MGASVYFDRLSEGLLPTVKQTIFSAHAVYVTPAFEWLNEVVLVRESSDLGTFQSLGFYTQVARQFGKFRPYARYQYQDAAENDLIVQFSGMTNAHHWLSLGVRYDFSDLAALKLQWDHPLGAHGSAANNELTLQLGFTF